MNARNHIRVTLDVDDAGAEELLKLARERKWSTIDRKDFEEPMTNLDVICRNLMEIKSCYEEYKDDIEEDEVQFLEDEYGSDCTWQIACHPVFSDSTPCLNDERGVDYPSGKSMDEKMKWEANCSECKARWLMEVYE